MSKNTKINKTKKEQNNRLPMVSICTPTFNRRPFIPYIILCVKNQTYPLEKIEWVIVDDGTDPIGDLLENITFVNIKYIRVENKMTLGEKRNFMHTKCSGDIFVYMDDDDYYPPERISHAVEMLLQNSDIMIAGSSLMNLYFKDIGKMYAFGPYGPYHATAATFAFKRALLEQTEYDSSKSIAEESQFLKNYTIPMVQLDPLKTILVFSHIHNSVNKMELLEQGNLSTNPYIKECEVKPRDYIKDEYLYSFYVDNMNTELSSYNQGHPDNKPDVLLNISNNKIKMYQRQLEQATEHINSLSQTNELLRETNKRLTERLRSMVNSNIDKHKSEWNVSYK
jgi:glycosyltransferase involved in cell wall biosynthesis